MAEQKSRLAIEIDSREAERNAKAVTRELKSIETTGDFAAKSVEGTSKSLTAFAQEGAKGASSAKVFAGQIGYVSTQSKSASDGLSKVTQSTNASTASMNTASTAAQALASRIMAIATVGAAISKMDAFAGFENRLKLVTTGQTELNKAMNDTFRIAQDARQEWDSVVQVYQRFSDNAKTLGIDMQKTAELTETVSKAVAISGASTAAAEASLTQFGQALASGVLRGEELNSVMEQTPGLAKAIAQGMGITVGQLRAVAAEGKITTDVLVDALTKSKDSVDELFGKTSMTIGQSMTYLSNEVTKFTGEAGKSSGAATALASSIKLLGDNLDVITGGAILAGIGYITMAIAKQGDAMRVNMATMIAKQAANRAEIASQVAEATASLNAAKAHLANVQATNAEAQAKFGATAAALRYSQAQAAVTAATNVQSAAQARLTATTITYQRIASGAWSLIGGPIGALTLGVTGLAAGYMYLSGRAEEATAKIKQQGEAANKTADELKKLEGREKALTESDLSEAFEAENKKLKELNFTFNAHVIAIQNAHKGNVEIADISNQVRQGIISQEEAIKRLNTLNFVDPQQFKQLKDANIAYDDQRIVVQKNADAQGHLGIQVELTGNKASNAQGKNAALANSHDLVANAANREAGAQQELAKQRLAAIQAASMDENVKNQRWINNVKAHGGGEEGVKKANFTENWLAENKIPYGQALSPELSKQLWTDYAIYENRVNLQAQVTKQTQAQAKAERDKTKEIEKQNKLIAGGARLVGISGNSGTTTGPHLHVQYGGKKKGDRLTAEHLNRLNANGKGLASFNVSSKLGHRKPPTAGASSDHKGIDIGMPVGTPITTNVAIRSVTTHTQRDKSGQITGAGHYTRIVYEDGLIMEVFHQVPDIHKKIKGGASSGSSNSRTYSQQESYEAKQQREAEQFAKETETLKADYYTIAQKDAADHEKRMADLRKHGLTKEVEMERERYEKTKQLRALEQILEVDGWRWVGEEKIKNDAAVNKLRIEASFDFDEKVKAEHIISIDEQRDYEVAAYRRLQQEKMKEFRSTIEQQTAEYQRMYYDALARYSMPQPAFNRWEAQNAYSDQMGAAWDNKQKAIDEANKKDSTTDQYLNDANTRNQMLIEAEQAYQATILAIKQKGVLDERNVMMQSQTDYFGMYNQLLTQASTVWGSMTQMVKDSAGESNAVYKAMFLAQQGIAIGQAIINTEVGATAALKTDPTGFMSMMTRAMGYASVGLIAAQTIQGMAHNGIDNIPKEGTWLLDGGERVLNPKQNKDLTNYLEKRNSQQDQSPMIERQRLAAIGEAKASRSEALNAPVTVYVTVQSDGSSEVKSEGASKDLGLALGNGVRKIIRDEFRQGGIIDNELRRRSR